MRRRLAVLIVCAGAMGCNTPWQANIELRKENQRLRDDLGQAREASRAAEGTRVVTTRPGTPGAVDLDKLFTVSSLSFGRLTGVEDGRLRIFVTPQDASGDELKTAGSFEVLAYDLSKGSNALVGRWEFSVEQARAAWNGKGLLYGYVLECPLAARPDSELSVRVVFEDLLTGRRVQGEVRAKSRS